MKDTRVRRACRQCGALMLVKRCLLGRKKFCSRVCLGRATIALKMAHRRKAESNSSWFTSSQVRGAANANWRAPIIFTCVQCRQPFGLKPYEVERRTLHCGYAPRFCSRACHLDHRRAHHGPASQYWRGGNMNYRGPGWRVVRLAIIDRQQGQCADCGAILGTRLHVHHRRRFKTYHTPAEANHPANLVGLCRTCHGKADGRPDAFRQFNKQRQARRDATAGQIPHV